MGVGINKINKVVLSQEFKDEIDALAKIKYVENIKNDLTNQIKAIVSDCDWKESVNTFADILTTYSSPQDGWVVNTKDTDYTYRYDDGLKKWIVISANAIPKATSSIDGIMSKENVIKLENIQANAQVNPTSQQILEQLKTVDGTNSGLDADLLEGKEGDYYLNHNNFTNVPDVYTKTESNTLLNGKSGSNHNHDNRYYTETEVDNIVGSDDLTTTKKTLKGALNEIKALVTVGGSVDNASKLDGKSADYYLTVEDNKSKIKTVTSADPIISLPNSVDGIMNIELQGNTRYKKTDGTYTDTWEDGVVLESVGEKQADGQVKIEVLSRGKNLFDKRNIYNNFYADYATGFFPPNPSYCASDFIPIIEGKTYHKEDEFNQQYAFYDKNKKYTHGIMSSNLISPIAGDCYIILSVNKSIIDTFQFEEGLTATTYESYKENKINILTQDELRGLPNKIKDYIRDDEIVRNVGEVVLNGSENWDNTFSVIDTVIRFDLVLNAKDNPTGSILNLCVDNFKLYPIPIPNNTEGMVMVGKKIIIFIPKSKLITPDLVGFKKWLSENPTTVYYELVTPTTEKLPQPLNLESFKGGSLEVVSTIPPYTTIKYPTNLAGGLQTTKEGLSERINNLNANKVGKEHTHTKSQITDIPTKLSQFENDNNYMRVQEGTILPTTNTKNLTFLKKL